VVVDAVEELAGRDEKGPIRDSFRNMGRRCGCTPEARRRRLRKFVHPSFLP
jgi:hypothetical protein